MGSDRKFESPTQPKPDLLLLQRFSEACNNPMRVLRGSSYGPAVCLRAIDGSLDDPPPNPFRH
jgi:hypothetical protein